MNRIDALQWVSHNTHSAHENELEEDVDFLAENDRYCVPKLRIYLLEIVWLLLSWNPLLNSNVSMCISPKRCRCNVSTGHAQGPSQWVPVFSQAIPFPQSSHHANIRWCTCST